MSCICYRVLNVETMKEPEATALVAAVETVAKCMTTDKNKHSENTVRARDCTRHCWQRLVDCAAAVHDPWVMTALLSARYAFTTTSSCSLLYLVMAYTGPLLVLEQRVQWLLGRGVCTEQGLVSEHFRMTCRPACVATSIPSVMRAMQRAGFWPSPHAMCGGRGLALYPLSYPVSWARWHLRRARRGWCRCTMGTSG